MISQPGIYSIPASEYHSDPCMEPSLSASIAKTLLTQSPWHAKHEHPRLNPALVREESEAFDLGTAAHAYLLEGVSSFEVIDAENFLTKDARAKRDAARLAGKTPILARRLADVKAMAEAAWVQLAAHEAMPEPFKKGKPEQTLVWQEGPIWCRARVDWLHESGAYMDDLKTSSASANPDDWTRTLFGAGYDIQAAFYLRGLKALTGQDATFRFVVQENYAPFALSVIALAPDALALAERKVRRAIELWRACLDCDLFPGYPTQICYAELPPWHEAQVMEKEMREDDESAGTVAAL